VVLGAGETFAALIHHLTTADKEGKRCSWDGKLTFREFFGLKKNETSVAKKEESFAVMLPWHRAYYPRNCIYFNKVLMKNFKIFVKVHILSGNFADICE
jgi:hypothetical protein